MYSLLVQVDKKISMDQWSIQNTETLSGYRTKKKKIKQQ